MVRVCVAAGLREAADGAGGDRACGGGVPLHDLRELMQSQTQTNLQIAEELRELNIRVQNLEHKSKSTP